MARSYHVLEVLGRGGFGVVYRAEAHDDDGFVRAVALKVLSDDAPEAADALPRLRDEAWLLGRLSHRALVAAHGFVRLPIGWTLVLEHVEGADVRDLLRQGSLPTTVALAIAEEVAGALHHAWHAEVDGRPLRLLHRDVKPGNVRITPQGEVKLLDLGAAKADFARRAQTGTFLLGTLRYLAPERVHGQEGPAADVFSLGVVLAELLGARPDDGVPTPSSIRRLLDQVADTLGARGVPVSVRGPLIGLVRRATAPDPEARPDAGTFATSCRALRRSLDGPELADWAAVHVRPTPRRDARDDPWVGAVLTEDAPKPPRRTWPVAAGLAAVAAVSLMGVAVGAGDATARHRTTAPSTLAVVVASAGRLDPAEPHTAPGDPPDVPLLPAPAPPLAVGREAPDRPPGTSLDAEPPFAGIPRAIVAPLVPDGPPFVGVPRAVVGPPPAAAPSAARNPRPIRPAADARGSSPQEPAKLPPAAAAPDPPLARVVVADPVPVRFARGGLVRPAGPLPAGTWTILADFGDGPVPAGLVEVPARGTVTLRCSTRRQACSAR